MTRIDYKALCVEAAAKAADLHYMERDLEQGLGAFGLIPQGSRVTVSRIAAEHYDILSGNTRLTLETSRGPAWIMFDDTAEPQDCGLGAPPDDGGEWTQTK